MADDEKLVDPLLEPSDSDSDLDLEDNLAPPPTDNLDLEVVDEFDVADFDEDFDDDFEEEIKGEYNLQDDQYGEDFEKEFGHITCLLYTSPSPRDQRGSRMPSSA